jgi:ribosomal protein L35
MAISEAQARWRATPEGRAARAAQDRRRGKRHRPEHDADRSRRKLREAHGMTPDDLAAMLDAQDGRCYLCGSELTAGHGTHIDHDHSCCPPKRSCALCRRGLACHGCNVALGLTGDDPARLRQMADALEVAQLAVRARLEAASAAR